MLLKYFNDLINHYNVDPAFFLKRSNLENIRDNCDIPCNEKYSMIYYAKMVLEEMTNIQEMSNENGIEVLFLKGLIYAHDLYPNIYNRRFSDIDVLVRPKDIIRFTLLCKKLGYSFTNGMEITEKAVEEQLATNSRYHLDPIVRISDGKVGIYLEVHFVLDTSWFTYDYEKMVDAIFNCSERYTIGRTVFFIPSIEDRLIFALHHFSRHLVGNIANTCFPDNKSFFDLKTLYDAILVQNKYKNVISVHRIIERVAIFHFKYEVMVANKTLQMLFGESLIKDSQLSCIEDNNGKYWLDYLLSQIYQQITIEDILLNTNNSVYRQIVSLCLDNNIKYLCSNEYYGKPIILYESNDGLTKNRFGTICRKKYSPQSSDNCSAKFRFKWDAKYLYAEIKVLESDVCIYSKEDCNYYNDSCVIAIYNPNFKQRIDCITGIHIVPYMDKCGSVKLDFLYCGEWYDPRVKEKKYIPIASHDYSVRVDKNGYIIKARIKWDILNVEINNTDFLGMELVVNNIRPQSKEFECILAWSNVLPNYYNPIKFGKVYIQRKK